MERMDRTTELYEYIKTYKTENDGNCPTRQQMLDNTAHVTKSGVNYDLNKLARQELIKFGHNGQVMIIGGEWKYHPPQVELPF